MGSYACLIPSLLLQVFLLLSIDAYLPFSPIYVVSRRGIYRSMGHTYLTKTVSKNRRSSALSAEAKRRLDTHGDYIDGNEQSGPCSNMYVHMHSPHGIDSTCAQHKCYHIRLTMVYLVISSRGSRFFLPSTSPFVSGALCSPISATSEASSRLLSSRVFSSLLYS